MTTLSLRIRIDGNRLVIELIELGAQGDAVIAYDSITKDDLKALLDL